MRHPISVQPPSTYQLSNSQLLIFIILRHHIGAYHGPNLVFNPVTVTCAISHAHLLRSSAFAVSSFCEDFWGARGINVTTCASFEVMCFCRVVVLWGFLGRARDKHNTYPVCHSNPLYHLKVSLFRGLSLVFSRVTGA